MARPVTRNALVAALSVGWLLGRRGNRASAPAVATDPPGLASRSSGEEIAIIAREAQLAQLQALDSIDGKAANLIAFSGIVIGLVFSSSFASAHWSVVVSLGAGFLGAGTVPLAFVLLIRRPRFDPAIGALSDVFSSLPPETTHREIARAITSAIDRNEQEMKTNIWRLRGGAVSIIVGLILVAGSLIYSHYDNGPPAQSPTQPIVSH